MLFSVMVTKLKKLGPNTVFERGASKYNKKRRAFTPNRNGLWTDKNISGLLWANA